MTAPTKPTRSSYLGQGIQRATVETDDGATIPIVAIADAFGDRWAANDVSEMLSVANAIASDVAEIKAMLRCLGRFE